MQLDEFLEQRRPSWQALETLLTRAGTSTRLSAAEVADLGRYYRLATADLALAQRDFAGHRVTPYLNQLVGRAHALIYRGEAPRWERLRRFYTTTFPQLYRQLLPYTTVSFLLVLLPAVGAFIAVWQSPATIYTLFGPQIGGLVRQVEQGRLWTDIAPTLRSTAAASILTNNIQVMFLTFAGGILAGTLTVFTLVMNGLNLGGIFGLLHAHGLTAGLAEFVAAHGFIELSVIFLAGGCGLSLADGLIRPGLLGRREALMQRGRVAVQLIIGCVPILILAGLIEGFISPSSIPWWLKLTVGLATGLGLHAYWLLSGRRSAAETSPGQLPRRSTVTARSAP